MPEATSCLTLVWAVMDRAAQGWWGTPHQLNHKEDPHPQGKEAVTLAA